MGTWGAGTFENDSASDWVWELEASETLAPVEAALAAVPDDDAYLDADVAVMALAASEVIAALRGRPAADLPEEVQAWVAGHPQPVADALLQLARAALARIIDTSELRELWDESDESAAWQRAVTDLQNRLS